MLTPCRHSTSFPLSPKRENIPLSVTTFGDLASKFILPQFDMQLIEARHFYYFHIRHRSEGKWKTMQLNQLNLFIEYFCSETEYFKAFNMYRVDTTAQPDNPSCFIVSEVYCFGPHFVLFSNSKSNRVTQNVQHAVEQDCQRHQLHLLTFLLVLHLKEYMTMKVKQ